MSLSNIKSVSNVELWNMLRKKSPTFRSHTSEGTSEMFTERGFEALKAKDPSAINEFFEISIRSTFQFITKSRAKNPLEGCGLVEKYSTPNGGFVQRMSVGSMKPISPKFHNLENGKTVDPYVIRKPEEIKERFFKQNFSYQSLTTIQNFQVKPIFVSEYGMGEFLAAITEGFQNGYTIQEYENAVECLNALMNSTEWPLQDTQVISVDMADKENPTNEELTNMIIRLKDVFSDFETSPQTSAYNAGKFATVVDKSDLVFLMKPKYKNRISVNLLTGAFNPETLSLPIEPFPIANFGGLKPYKEDTYTTPLYEVYDSFGTVIGYNESEGQSNVTVNTEDVCWKDPNEDVIGLICQKGIVFENIQNPVEIRPIMNPAGLYDNYWMSSPNNTIAGDPYYTMIAVKAVTA